MSAGDKTLLVLAGIAAILGTVVFSALVILLQDEPPPPDDSDLVPSARPEVPADRNAWTYYAQALEKVKLPKKGEDADWPPAPPAPAATGGKPAEDAAKTEPGDPPPDIRDRWIAIEDTTSWEQPLVDEVLKRNAEALALWEKGLAAPECLVPEAVPPMGTVPWLSNSLEMARLSAVRVRNFARQDNDEAAMDEAVRIVRFGHHLEGGKGLIVTYLVGTAVKQMGLSEVIELVPAGRVPPGRLRQVAAELARYQADPRSLADALRAEYGFGRIVVEKVASREFDAGAVLGFRPSRADSLRMLFFKPNRTRRLMAEAFREMVRAAPMHRSEMPDLDRFPAAAMDETRFFNGNYVGGQVCRAYVGNMMGMTDLKCTTNVQVAAARVLLAMKAFKLEKGRLPATLDELVPGYLDAVPLDDFDGKPLRYNPAKKVIYSVGKDLRDDGGMTKKEYVDYKVREGGVDPKDINPDELKYYESEYPGQGPDPSFPIEF